MPKGIPEEILERTIKAVSIAGGRVLKDYTRSRLADEEDITSQLLARIKDRLENLELEDFEWSTRVFTHRGEGAEERKIGADWVGVLNVKIPGYEVKKGFLVQAKRLKPGKGITDKTGLRRQIKRMQRETAKAAFLAVYSEEEGIVFIPAEEALSTPNLLGVGMTLEEFFTRHFICKIGDQKIQSVFRDDGGRWVGIENGIEMNLQPRKRRTR